MPKITCHHLKKYSIKGCEYCAQCGKFLSEQQLFGFMHRDNYLNKSGDNILLDLLLRNQQLIRK